MEAHNELEPVGAAGGRLIGTVVIQCALLTEYFLSTVISQALGAHNDAIFRPNILLEDHHRQFDVPCFYGRDVEKCRALASHWYGDRLPDLPTVGS